MRRAGLLIVAMLLILSCFSLSKTEAFWGKKKETQEQAPKKTEETKPTEPAKPKTETQLPAEATSKIDKDQQARLEAQRVKVNKKRNELNNTEWQIEIYSLANKEKLKATNPVIVFKDNRVACLGIDGMEFPATNYTLTVQDDGIVVWETMQTSERSGVAFWRGEITPDMQSMQGSLSHHIDEENLRDYAFRSLGKKRITP
ncbi:MAG: hypothetical protein NC908_03790 [Candidatus Omnitrophica bacterium]|nr:hypothetical protein [Candidatus Omnitrophota bacterium]